MDQHSQATKGESSMILGQVNMLANHYQCNLCDYDWYSIAKRIPDSCPNRDCRSREWNGKKKKRIPAPKPKIELPKPTRKRIEDVDDEF
jgi:ribosomal protein L37E